MTFKKIKKYLFKDEHLDRKKLWCIFLLCAILMLCMEKAIEKLPLELWKFTDLAIADIDFNDIYYQTYYQPSQKRDVILINTGSLEPQYMRNQLGLLLAELDKYQPSAVGIDMIFTDVKDSADTHNLHKLIVGNNVVIGKDLNHTSVFDSLKPKPKSGYINLPITTRASVREYYNHYDLVEAGDTITYPSFARRLYAIAEGDIPDKSESTSLLRYDCIGKGFYEALHAKQDTDSAYYCFPAVEGYDVLARTGIDNDTLRRLIKGKIVIVGHLGSPWLTNSNDMLDKHSTPTDWQLVNRIPIMPGAVVHANAVQMLMDKSDYTEISDPWYSIMLYGLLAGCFWLFFIFEKRIRNIPLAFIIDLLFLLFLTFFLIWLGIVLVGMGYHLRILKMVLMVVLLVEFKGFAFALYHHWEEHDAEDKRVKKEKKKHRRNKKRLIISKA